MTQQDDTQATSTQNDQPETETTGELEILKNLYARSQADYQNLLRRNESERVELGKFLTKKILSHIFPLVDNLERATANVPESLKNETWTQGIVAMRDQIQKELKLLWVEAFESVNTEPNPDLHEVLGQIPGKENTIVAEVEKGYTLHGEVLRHAKVMVGNGTITN